LGKPTVTHTHAEYISLSAHVDVIKKRTQRRHGAAHPALENEIVQHSNIIPIDIFELLQSK